MQRIGWVLLVSLMPAAATTQETAGATLWRVAAATLPIPQALVTGGTGGFWNPAQRVDRTRALFALEVIQSSSAVGVSGFLAGARTRVRPLGTLGLVLGRMELGDLVRTSLSPDPDMGTIPYYTQSIGATWSATPGGATGAGRTTLGAMLAVHDTRLDLERTQRWTLDVGAERRITEALRVAAATHFFSSLRRVDPAQDVYGGIEYRVWRGRVWGDGAAAVRVRYGVTLAHAFEADHQFGAGLSLGAGGRGGEGGEAFGADVLVVREGGYSRAGWRPTAGIRVAIGRYGVTFARDSGVNDVGAAYRVGLEARLR